MIRPRNVNRRDCKCFSLTQMRVVAGDPVRGDLLTFKCFLSEVGSTQQSLLTWSWSMTASVSSLNHVHGHPREQRNFHQRPADI